MFYLFCAVCKARQGQNTTFPPPPLYIYTSKAGKAAAFQTQIFAGQTEAWRVTTEHSAPLKQKDTETAITFQYFFIIYASFSFHPVSLKCLTVNSDW